MTQEQIECLKLLRDNIESMKDMITINNIERVTGMLLAYDNVIVILDEMIGDEQ